MNRKLAGQINALWFAFDGHLVKGKQICVLTNRNASSNIAKL